MTRAAAAADVVRAAQQQRGLALVVEVGVLPRDRVARACRRPRAAAQSDEEGSRSDTRAER